MTPTHDAKGRDSSEGTHSPALTIFAKAVGTVAQGAKLWLWDYMLWHCTHSELGVSTFIAKTVKRSWTPCVI